MIETPKDRQKRISKLDALKQIDMSKIAPEEMLALIQQNAELKREVMELKEANKRTRLADQMTPNEYNWCVDVLQKVRITYDNVVTPPVSIVVEPVKIFSIGEC